MFTDGVTTRDETIAQVASTPPRGVPLFFVGIGDDHEIRDLQAARFAGGGHHLRQRQRAVFEARLTGKGYKDLSVPVVLKIKDKDGKEKELARKTVKVDPNGKAVQVSASSISPRKSAASKYIIEVEPPKAEREREADRRTRTCGWSG